jgi:acyl carrier protein
MWYKIDFLMSGEPVCEAVVRVPADSAWFDGHFPGRPVLPGIAQLAMVQDLLGRVLGDGGRIVALSRVRFRQAVGPGARLKVATRPRGEAPGTVAFRILQDEALVCSGIAVLADKGQAAVQGEQAMELEQLMRRIAAIMIDEIKLEDVTPETFDPDLDLVDEVGIDSMDLATVALVLRDEYAVRIDEDDYPKLTTLRRIAAYIHARLQVAELN